MKESIVRRLVFAKYQLNLSKNLLANITKLGAWQAILNLHDALEMLLTVIADKLHVKKAWSSFHECLDNIEAKSKIPFSNRSIFSEVNDLRNPLKHHGIPPNVDAVRQVLPKVQLVFQENATKYLQISFDDLSLADMVENPEVKKEIKHAENAIAKSQYGDALASLRFAFDRLSYSVKKNVPWKARNWLDLPDKLFDDSVLNSVRADELGSVARSFSKANENFDKLRRLVWVLALGLNPTDFAKFEYLTPYVATLGNGQRQVVYSAHSSPLIHNSETAAFALDFVIDAALRFQGGFHVHDLLNSYRLRLNKETQVFAYHDGAWTAVGILAEGDEIPSAQQTLVAGKGDYWSWKEGQDQVYVPMESAEIIEELIHTPQF